MAGEFTNSTTDYFSHTSITNARFRASEIWSFFAQFRIDNLTSDYVILGLAQFDPSHTHFLVETQASTRMRMVLDENFVSTIKFVAANTWYTLAITCNGSGATPSVALNIRVLSDVNTLQTDETHTFGATEDAEDATINVGAETRGGWSIGFDGQLANLAYFSGVELTSADILNEYHHSPITVVGRNFSNCEFFWPMVGGEGTDYSGNVRNLTEVGTINAGDHPPVASNWGQESYEVVSSVISAEHPTSGLPEIWFIALPARASVGASVTFATAGLAEAWFIAKGVSSSPKPVATLQTFGTTTGPAPLHLFFDGSASASITAARSFRDLYYHFDYGDTTSSGHAGVWDRTNNKTKGSDEGPPLAAHVYEFPGTYTVTMTVTDATGAFSTDTQVVTVETNDVGYTGTKVVSTGSITGSEVGYPTDGAPITDHPNITTVAGIVALLETGKRVLLKRGDSWTTASATTINNAWTGTSPSLLGAWGDPAAAKPLFTVTTAGTNFFFMDNNHDFRIMDLQFTGTLAPEVQNNTVFFHVNGTSNDQSKKNLFFRCDCDHVSGLCVYHTPDKFDGLSTRNEDIAWVDCEATDWGDPGHGAIVFTSGIRVTIMGCNLDKERVDDPTTTSQIIRIAWARGAVISHCNLVYPDAGHVPLKITGRKNPNFDPMTGAGTHDDDDEPGDNQWWNTRYICVYDTLLKRDNTQFGRMCRYGETIDNTAPNNCADITHDRLVYVYGDSHFNYVSARRCIWRNCLFIGNFAGNIRAMRLALIQQENFDATPKEIWFFNNTLYDTATGLWTGFVNLGSSNFLDDPDDIRVQNNIAFFSNGDFRPWSGPGTNIIVANNLEIDSAVTPASDVFVSASPGETSTDYQLIEASPAVDTGNAIDLRNHAVIRDHINNPRPNRLGFDMGAFEFPATIAGLPVIDFIAIPCRAQTATVPNAEVVSGNSEFWFVTGSHTVSVDIPNPTSGLPEIWFVAGSHTAEITTPTVSGLSEIWFLTGSHNASVGTPVISGLPEVWFIALPTNTVTVPAENVTAGLPEVWFVAGSHTASTGVPTVSGLSEIWFITGTQVATKIPTPTAGLPEVWFVTGTHTATVDIPNPTSGLPEVWFVTGSHSAALVGATTITAGLPEVWFIAGNETRAAVGAPITATAGNAVADFIAADVTVAALDQQKPVNGVPVIDFIALPATADPAPTGTAGIPVVDFIALPARVGKLITAVAGNPTADFTSLAVTAEVPLESVTAGLPVVSFIAKPVRELVLGSKILVEDFICVIQQVDDALLILQALQDKLRVMKTVAENVDVGG